VARAWPDFLRVAASSDHAVQVYADLGELSDSVAAYVVAGFEAGAPAVVIATREHWRRFAERLDGSGWDAGELERRGQLTVIDAEAMLAALMAGEAPSSSAFEQVAGTLLDGVAERFPGQPVRVFGDMADLLCERGQVEAAAALEELWNRLAARRRFSLLCGYRLDLFDLAAQTGALPDVCRLHSHVRPAADPARLARAVDMALGEVLGPDQAGQVYGLVGNEVREDKVPIAQLALMWVSENMPVRAERVLARAREHYADSHHPVLAG
jgi:MEDS: MEthanogen/methylotroph, DcmR Sensory domain